MSEGQQSRRYLRVQRVKPFWTRRAKLVLAGLLIVFTIPVVFGDYGLLRIIELRRERRQLEEKIAHYKMKVRLLEIKKQKLLNDPFTIEKIARERCGLYKPGELIFIFEDADSNKSEAPVIPLDKLTLSP